MFRNLFIRFFAATMLASFLLFVLSCNEEHVIALDPLHLDQMEFYASSEGGNYDVNANETIQLTSNSKNFQINDTERLIRNSCTSPFSQTRQTQHVKTI